jgi:predicted thioesterase
MNFDQIADLTVRGRFRIPFPDTSYVSGERREKSTSTRAAGSVVPADDATNASEKCVDRRSLRCFVTAHVVASIENLCASELAAYTNSAAESVTGSEVLLKHNHPAAVGSMVSVEARVKSIVDQSVTFDVQAMVGETVIADGQLRLVVVARDRFAPKRIQSVIERAFADISAMGAAAPVAPDLWARVDTQRRDTQRRDTQRRDPQQRDTQAGVSAFSAAA